MLLVAYETYFYNLSIDSFYNPVEERSWSICKHYTKFFVPGVVTLDDEGLMEL